MQKILLWSVVLACLGVALLTDGVRAQRARPEAITRTPTQVVVTNFPTTQNVAGTVNVGNLPVNAEGSIRVTGTISSPPAQAHFVGLTGVVLGGRPGPLIMSRTCESEFPGTRACDTEELLKAIPVPPPWTTYARAIAASDIEHGSAVCVSPDGTSAFNFGGFDGCQVELPVACCGF